MMTYKGYAFVPSSDRGGKAGRNKGKTRSIQIQTRPTADGTYFLKKQIRYEPTKVGSLERAVEKAKAWVDALLIEGRGDPDFTPPRHSTPAITVLGREDEMVTLHRGGKFWFTIFAPCPEAADELLQWLTQLQNK